MYNIQQLNTRLNVLDRLYPRNPSNTEAPRKLVEEILDRLPIDWSNMYTTFCNPCEKTGIWLGCIYMRLMNSLSGIIIDEQERSKHILEKQLFAYTISEESADIIRATLYGNLEHVGNVVVRDVLKDGIDMKFDCVIGNPPFNSGGKGTAGTAGYSTLYRKFYDLSNRLTKNIIALILPKGIMKYTRFNSNNVRYISMMTNNHWQYDTLWLISKLNNADNIHILDPIISKMVAIKKQYTFPIYIQSTTIDQLTKTGNILPAGKYKVITKLPGKNNDMLYGYTNKENLIKGPKFVCTILESKKSYTITDELCLASCCIIFPQPSIEYAICLKRFIEHSKLFKYFTQKMKVKGHTTGLQYLKSFDLSQIKNGTEYPIEYGLTQEEIDYIEQTIK